MKPISPYSRRQFLQGNALGIGSVASLAAARAAAATLPGAAPAWSFDLAKLAPRGGRARAMISLFMHGGPSHGSLRSKPELSRRSDEDYRAKSPTALWIGPAKTVRRPGNFESMALAAGCRLLPHFTQIVVTSA
jgi:hypothetical protein